MDTSLEYMKIKLIPEAEVKFIDKIQLYGNDGWELELGPEKLDYNEHSLSFRRSNEQPIWEYRIFDTKPMPDGWLDHLASCGWKILFPSYYNYGGYESCIFKREGCWRDTDDGDVIKQLGINGWTINKQYHFYEMKQVVSKVLDVKWIYSEKEGYNIGTHRAVKIFIENEQEYFKRY
ncbi:MAG: hypothetical protein EHM93_02265 [Bacteroidales bacterium]|nr:MAG: hypothetical protein EHM93_02265 [Bacteroidales bacterium]